MFNTLDVAPMGACPVFVAGTEREMSSLHIDEMTNFSTRKAAYRGPHPNQFRFCLLTPV